MLNFEKEKQIVEEKYKPERMALYIRIIVSIALVVLNIVQPQFLILSMLLVLYLFYEVIRLQCKAENEYMEMKKKKIKYYDDKRNRQPQDNEWVCPSCGRINSNYVGTCGCGYSKIYPR